MRILWFANTPCGAAARLGMDIQVGGWLAALEKGLKTDPEIDLHVAFYHDRPMEAFREAGVTYHPIHRRHDPLAKLRKLVSDFTRADLQDIERMRRVVDAVAPDLVHVHGTEENFGLLLEHIGVPAVVSLQGILGPYENLFHSGIPRAFLRRKFPWWSFRTKGFGHYYMALAARREARILSGVRWIFGRTEWDRRVASVLAPRATYLHGGEILRDVFYRAAAIAREDAQAPLEICSVISGGVYKGLETILLAARLLKDLDVPLRWSIVGLPPDDPFVEICEAYTGTRASQVGVGFLGRMGGEDLAARLAGSDLFVHASHIENSPNSVCEAMILGLPVVSTDSGGTRSLLQTGREGILVQPGEPYSMAGAILELARDPAKRRELGGKAREVALARHDPRLVCEGIRDGYRRMIRDGAPAAVDATRGDRR